MDPTYMINVTIRLLLELCFEWLGNSWRILGFGPKKFANFPDSLKGKVVLITGANSGIGKATARAFAKLDAKVIMACRDMAKAHIAATHIKKEFKNADLILKKLDLSSLISVKQFCRQINQEINKIDYLVNNAGVMFCPKGQTEDGFEMQFGVNHLGHFLLTNLLIEKLFKASNARIINVSSVIHIRGEINWDDINMDQSYNRYQAHANSKLANVLFTRELANRLSDSDVKAYCLHPGLVNTNLYQHLPAPFSWAITLGGWVFNVGANTGAQTTLYCALEPSISAESGYYYKDCKRVENLVANAVDDISAQKLWDFSCKLVDIEDNYI